MSPTTLEGQTLGKYQVLDPLGRGGMAQVYKAYHPQLDRYVAIKVLRPDLAEDPEFLARFQREARSVAGLRHPNIVQVYDFDVQDELYYMVMELLDGNTLKAYQNGYRTRGERLPLADTLRIAQDVLAGLSYAHNEGIVHRDIKPANILLSLNGRAVITDFGIAQIMDATRYTVSGALMGTLAYMAPEQGIQGHADQRSDIYSLGIVLFELVTGKVPFDADTPLAILMKHVNDPLPLPHKLEPSLPEPVERVILKALAKNADDRFQNAGEMAQALAAAGREAGLELPESLPLQHLAPSASQAVKVLSGDDRQRITDRQFAADETDASLGRRLGTQETPAGPAAPPPPNAGQTYAANRTTWRSRGEAIATHVERAIRPITDMGEPGGAADTPDRQQVTQAVFKALLVLLGANTLLGLLGAVLNNNLFGWTWPIELALVGLLLASLMQVLGLIWMLVPTGIFLGNALIFSFYTLTGRWTSWGFLWPIEPMLIVGVVFLTLKLKDPPEDAPARSRLWGRRCAQACVICSAVLMLASFTLALFS